jgi:hypothetical protein
MPPGDAGDELRQALWDVVGRLDGGNWRAVVHNSGFIGRAGAGPGHLVRWASALGLVALSMQAQAEGRVHDAWDRLSEAAALLPPQLVRRDRSTAAVLAVLRPMPADTAPLEERLVVGIARLVWREQQELADLRRRFAHGRMKARDELIEGCIQFLIWVIFDPTSFYRVKPGEAWDGTTVEPSRAVLCLYGTEIRCFANPTADTGISQAPWQDIGGYRGLAANAFDRLADRSAPAPWCGAKGTSGLVVRRGRLRAWQHACRRREDLRSL